MRTMRVTNTERGVVLGTSVRLADRWWPRMRGFLGRPAPEPGEGLLLTPCQAVHMFGMRFSLDVVFLDRDGVVVAVYEDLAPGKRTRVETKAIHALELPAGTVVATGTERGDRVAWVPSESHYGTHAAEAPGAAGGNGRDDIAPIDPREHPRVERDIDNSGNGRMWRSG